MKVGDKVRILRPPVDTHFQTHLVGKEGVIVEIMTNHLRVKTEGVLPVWRYKFSDIQLIEEPNNAAVFQNAPDANHPGSTYKIMERK